VVPPPARSLRSAPVLLLAATGFAIGSTEFLAVGVVPEIARDLHVSTGAAGLTVSLYAVGVALTTIPMTVAFGHRRPRGVVAAMVCLFALAHGVMAIAPSLPVLLAGRILAATGHGLAMGLAMTTAAAIVAEADRGRAVASVLGGLLTAMFLGAPLGTWLSDLVGWRLVFAGLGAGALVLAALILRVVPDVPGAEDGGWSSLRPLRRPTALRPMALTIGILAGGSILFAYLGAYLDEVTGLPPSGVALGLAAFGGAGIAGNALGGRMAGRGADRAKLLALWILPPAVLVTGLGGSVPAVVLGALVVWSVAELSIMPVLAHEAIEAAGSVAGPVQNAAANAGIAIGGLAGAGVVALGGVQATPYAGAAVLAAVALWVSVRQTVAKDLARSRRERMPSLR
jgi:MFS transporter, DHA1 family, inner membrane transport protein